MSLEIISTTLVAATATPPAGPYDLTDLATVHDEVELPLTVVGSDQFLSRAITQSSSAISNYCNRIFQVETLQDQIFLQQDPYPYQVPGGVDPLQLSRWPLVNAISISFTGNTYERSKTVALIPNTDGLVVGQLVFASDGSLPAGTVINEIATDSITLSNPAPANNTQLSFTTGLQVTQMRSLGDVQTLVYGKDFTIDAARGWLIRLNSWTGSSQMWEAQPITVTYQAGYPSIPGDLVDACLRLVTARFKARGRDPMLIEQTQQGSGSQHYWVGIAHGQHGAFAAEIESLISQYRVPVVA